MYSTLSVEKLKEMRVKKTPADWTNVLKPLGGDTAVLHTLHHTQRGSQRLWARWVLANRSSKLGHVWKNTLHH